MFSSKLWVALTVLAIAIAVAGWWFTSNTTGGSGQNNTATGSTATTQQATKTATPELPDIASDKQVVSVPSLQLAKQQEVTVAAGTQVTNKNQALAVIQEKQQQLGLGQGSTLEIAGDTSDEFGNSYYQLEQNYKGIPIYGAKSVLEVEHGEAVLISGSWLKNIALDITPTSTAKIALRKALDLINVPAEREVKEFGESALIIFPSDQGAKLCWLMQAMLTNPESDAELFIVDAQNPEILLRAAAVIE